MLKILKSVDLAVIERIQVVFDRAWDDFGIGVGHVICGTAIVAGGLAFDWGTAGTSP